MNIQQVKSIVGDTPHMSLGQAKRMRRFIREHDCKNILELGFKHGVSTCYMATTLAELGRGSIVTIDRESARTLAPNVEQLLTEVRQRARVDVFYEPTSYTWRMMRMLEQDPTPRFDLCYLDGAHSWFVDALAFFLVDRLLVPGGWIIFDDMSWSYANSPTVHSEPFVRAMPKDERETPQVARIFELLVRPHPNYHHLRVEDEWGYAQKRDVVQHAEVGGGRLRAPLRRVASSLRELRGRLSVRAAARALAQ